MNTASSKHLSDIRSDFERGVFMALYTSRQQRRRRRLAYLLLALKHGLRGILFSWPLYLLPLAAWLLQLRYLSLIVLLLLPGVVISAVILSRGVREDYANLVDGYILESDYAMRMLFPGTLLS
jgi:hypothetical protein